MTFVLDNYIKEITKDLSLRQRDILFRRFGLKGVGKATLAAIGKEYSITRERVRQIESQCLGRIKKTVKSEPAFLARVIKHLRSFGGVRRDDILMKEIKDFILPEAGKDKAGENKIRFILEVAGRPYLARENDKFHAFWFLDSEAKSYAGKFIKDVIAWLEKSGETRLVSMMDLPAGSRGSLAENYFSISKELKTNVFGNLGLAEWRHINPKTIRDKIYITLRRQNRPMHFKDITDLINKSGFEGRKAHLQTVHNELIRDNRFVLVGRGLYALYEQGFEAGTTQEIIAKVLKEKGALKKPQILKLVRQKKMVQDNTIVLNLQNRDLFKRMDDGSYYLA